MTGSGTYLHGAKKLKAATYSLYVNVFLILLKVSVVYITGSLAILAELLHSGFDLLASIFAYIGIKKAELRPAIRIRTATKNSRTCRPWPRPSS
jgi:divalent metal cation (Fe/Co/Zn/Cd) transporter